MKMNNFLAVCTTKQAGRGRRRKNHHAVKLSKKYCASFHLKSFYCSGFEPNPHYNKGVQRKQGLFFHLAASFFQIIVQCEFGYTQKLTDLLTRFLNQEHAPFIKEL